VWEFTFLCGRALYSTRGIPPIAHPMPGDCHFGLNAIASYQFIKTTWQGPEVVWVVMREKALRNYLRHYYWLAYWLRYGVSHVCHWQASWHAGSSNTGTPHWTYGTSMWTYVRVLLGVKKAFILSALLLHNLIFSSLLSVQYIRRVHRFWKWHYGWHHHIVLFVFMSCCQNLIMLARDLSL
jgi:hypothetical protein